MIISEKHKFIFFANARTGTTSVERILQPYHDRDDLIEALTTLRDNDPDITCPNIKHMRPRSLKKVMPIEEWDSYFKFTFVRNPWDWTISQFLRHNPDSPVKQKAATLSVSQFYLHWDKMKKYRGVTSDPSYLQYHFLEGVDYVGRYETLRSDFEFICNRVNINPGELPHLNSAHLRDGYRDYYNPLSLAIAYFHYRRDFNALGYSIFPDK
ncbi:MAG: sulfotransferase family protein [Pseudomonadales bacterium]|nr:sulfotransferase family protein [Pseudomonadales bacterium]